MDDADTESEEMVFTLEVRGKDIEEIRDNLIRVAESLDAYIHGESLAPGVVIRENEAIN